MKVEEARSDSKFIGACRTPSRRLRKRISSLELVTSSQSTLAWRRYSTPRRVENVSAV
jgi:hypothetical protein